MIAHVAEGFFFFFIIFIKRGRIVNENGDVRVKGWMCSMGGSEASVRATKVMI